MRYEREIEGQIYLAMLQSGVSYTESAKEARKESDKIVMNWKVTDSIFEIIKRYTMRIPSVRQEINAGTTN